MGENIAFPGGGQESKEFDEQDSRQGVANMISMTALCEIECRYGGNKEGNEAEVKELPYHNVRHTAEVYTTARELAAKLGLTPRDQALAGLAAAAHDFEHQQPSGINEQMSADWLVGRMSGSGMGFSERDIITARLAVLGTSLRRATDGSYIGQQACLQEYPDESAEMVAKCVAAADMAHLYAPDSPLRSRDLYKEHLGVGSEDTPSLEGFLAFQRGVLQLLGSYRYPFEQAEWRFGKLRSAVLDHQQAITQLVFSKHITHWEQVLAEDHEFEELHSW